MGFVKFMSSSIGRGLRVVVGIALILLGLLTVEGAWGVVLVIIGLLPLAAGAFDICIFGPLLGAPLRGSEVRDE